MSEIKVDALSTVSGSGNITVSNNIAGAGTISGTNITASGTLGVTGLITASAGVAIGGTGSVNTLDDYEEGTWTPQMNIGGSNVTTTFTDAVYTKIGNIAHLFSVVTFASGTNTGTVKLTGAPFTAGSSLRYFKGVSTNDYATNPHQYYTASNGTDIIIRVGGTTQSDGSRNLNGNDIKDNTNMIFYFHITYKTV
tara:strand:- start:1764 stop:2348 length:585 start_codon:yes stop_codon:yes gene_type:complete